MGYFSNGSEGEAYQAQYCNKCAHDINQNCPIWSMHLLYNSGQGGDIRPILDMLIPRQGIYNKKCTMFIPLEGVPANPPDLNTELARLKAWNAGRAIPALAGRKR